MPKVITKRILTKNILSVIQKKWGAGSKKVGSYERQERYYEDGDTINKLNY